MQLSEEMVKVAGWLSPDDAIADDLFEIDQPVELLLATGEIVNAFYGYVEDSDGGEWRSFYDDDGAEIICTKIDKCRALAAPPKEGG